MMQAFHASPGLQRLFHMLYTEQEALRPARIRYLPANAKGNDLVIGDLHGCADLLDAMLDANGFNPGCDRLFSVGDIINRGPLPIDSLSLLRRPYFHAVRGNHEDLLCASLAALDKNTGQDKEKNILEHLLAGGGQWLLDENQRQQAKTYCQGLDQLPHMIVVGEGRSRFHVVHAEAYHQGRGRVFSDRDIDEGHLPWQPLVWSRGLMSTAPAQRDSNGHRPRSSRLSRTYCGHTVAPHVREAASHICLDTGSWLSRDGRYSLSMINTRTEELWQARHGRQRIEVSYYRHFSGSRRPRIGASQPSLPFYRGMMGRKKQADRGLF